MGKNNIKYSVTQYQISNILSMIDMGTIAIPDIQRPFVWSKTKVRDLIDSLYSGYPTGYIIIWQNPNVRLKNGQNSFGKQILIDGQQRLTALMAAILGKEVMANNYKKIRIKIAFNPFAKEDTERFAVQTPIHRRSKSWIPDIAEIFTDDFNFYEFMNEYIENNPDVDKKELNEEMMKLLSIRSSMLGAITLDHEIDISEVTEIFVRINSQGKRLNESDFVMSKIAAAEKYNGHLLRKAIDYFCHLAVEPSFYDYVESNDKEFRETIYMQKLRWLKDTVDDTYDPNYNDMLRVSFMNEFKRGKLSDLVSLLSGRDFVERNYKEEIAEESFNKLNIGILKFMNQHNFESFVLAITSCGFISTKIISSKSTINFAYALYLLLNEDNSVNKIDIKRYVQKWFVLSTLTSRYTGGFEAQYEQDLRAIQNKGYKVFLEEIESAELSDAFWEIGLIQNLETSSTSSSSYNVFLAAQVYFADRSLLSSTSKVSDLISIKGDVHHIFPKEYLKQSGFTSRSEYNQVANYTYLDTVTNISIGKKAPNVYFSEAFEQCETEVLKTGSIIDIEVLNENLNQNCMPFNIKYMNTSNYIEFLKIRRMMMANKIRKYYYSI